MVSSMEMMKYSTAVVMIASFGFGVAAASAKSHGGNSDSSSAPATNRSSSTTPTTAAPHFNVAPHNYSGGMPYRSGTMPYRATVNYQNGKRTLNYPAVGVSNVQRSTRSGVTNLNSARALQGNVGHSQHTAAVNIAAKNKLDPQTSARLRNWSGHVSNSSQARVTNINNRHHHHDHDWWRNRCASIIFFDFGWWGWYDGWWYPAWGYDPYSYYEYNEPIYGYGGLSPDQIVAGVQVALQQQGYYTWAIDGKMGPLTRAALAQYQRDHRLPITSGIDPATLGSLGVIR
jgi:hypothetical protein